MSDKQTEEINGLFHLEQLGACIMILLVIFFFLLCAVE